MSARSSRSPALAGPATRDARMTSRAVNGLHALNWAHAALALAVIAWLNIGVASFASNQVSNYIRWGVFALWLGLAILSERGFTRLVIGECWPLLVLATYMLIASVLGDASIDLYQNGIYYLLAVYSIFLFYFKERYRAIQKIFVWYLVFDAIVIGINTSLALARNPMLARYLATAASTRDSILGEETFYAVGGYAYAYSLGAIILALGFTIVHASRLWIPCVLALVAASSLLLRAAFSIAIILVVGIALAVTIGKLLRRYGRGGLTLVGVTGLACLFAVGGPFLRYVSTSGALPEVVAVRVGEVGAALSDVSGAGSDLSIRLGVYEESIVAFQNNALFGTAVNPLSSHAAGGHATWLDLLATFGWFGATMFIFLLKAYRFTLAHVHREGKGLVEAYWLYFVLLGMVNPLLLANIFTTWFLLLPLWSGMVGTPERGSTTMTSRSSPSGELSWRG